MAGNENLRAAFGQYVPVVLQFSEVEGGVTDGQSMNLVGIVGGEAAGFIAPLGGKIFGISAGSEASAAFGITPSNDGVDADAAYDLAITGVSQYEIYATPLAFSAGDRIGMNFEGTVSTAKDVNAFLLIGLDTIGG